MASIIDTMRTAQVNLTTNFQSEFARTVGNIQLENAIKMLELGYPAHTDIEETLEHYAVAEVKDLPQYFSQDNSESG